MPRKPPTPDRVPEKPPEQRETGPETVSESLRDHKPIRLSRITWKKPVSEIQGPAASQGSIREYLPGRARPQYVLEWYPWLRHFRIVYVERPAALELTETWVHESNANSWRRSFATE